MEPCRICVGASIARPLLSGRWRAPGPSPTDPQNPPECPGPVGRGNTRPAACPARPASRRGWGCALRAYAVILSTVSYYCLTPLLLPVPPRRVIRPVPAAAGTGPGDPGGAVSAPAAGLPPPRPGDPGRRLLVQDLGGGLRRGPQGLQNFPGGPAPLPARRPLIPKILQNVGRCSPLQEDTIFRKWISLGVPAPLLTNARRVAILRSATNH